ncbi:Trm112 family protein [Aggregicoccus sp. 17bor-14]|uniref:Trm112 family protein n=1 Tax=Myxococcaceae TaxID=31 RepID=UPI00129C3959|nr:MULTISPECIES: Trm112 family protein [Myxococcaceae]MBF5046312.1 Trm112 family protein [Simulacricoccus sp. 17bor-14]MRI92032.1 Trm112 family protein [Aggregicoccus sp. 17bor-14]
MKLEEAVLALLACPRCKGPLTHGSDGAVLVCAACRLAYPVEGGVPDLLPESARPLDLAAKSP